MNCPDCGQEYADIMALDLALPRSQWLSINPDEGGVLCANCILRRASKLPHVINLTAIITFAQDYEGEKPTPYQNLTALVESAHR